MARKDGRDRGVVFKNDCWWVRIYVRGRQKWYRADNKTQGKALYGRLRADIREGKYFPERVHQRKDVTLRAWLKRYREVISSKGLRNMHHYCNFWSKLLGSRLLEEISPDALPRIQAQMYAKAKRTPQIINRYFAGLRRVLNLAILEGYLISNPVKTVKFFPEP